jgi:hypothetical protein
MPADGPSGDRHKGGVSSVQARVGNVGTVTSMRREISEWQPHEGAEYRCEVQGADGLVVATKPL